jgi:hypothetical protein
MNWNSNNMKGRTAVARYPERGSLPGPWPQAYAHLRFEQSRCASPDYSWRAAYVPPTGAADQLSRGSSSAFVNACPRLLRVGMGPLLIV